MTIITIIISSTVVAAIVSAGTSAIVTTLLALKKAREEERSRVRTVYAEAFEAVAAYKELPYAIRRRRHDEPEAERIRLSEHARKIQERLSYYQAWIRGESEAVSAGYDTLVRQLRSVAGKACHDAWLAPARQTDAEMNMEVGTVDLAELKSYEDAYISAVVADLAKHKPPKPGRNALAVPSRSHRPELPDSG